MLSQTITVTTRILLLRAGPQDFPYSAALTRVVVAVALVMSYLQYHFTLTPGRAVLHALASVGVLAAFVQVALQMRGHANRMQQTVNSLFATGSLLTLLLLPPLSALAPHMVRLAGNPELAQSEPLPALPTLLVMGVSVWNFVVSAHIFRHALDTRLGFGMLVAVLAVMVNVVFSSAVTSLLPA